MSIFKQDEDYDEEELDREVPSKKFKDLNPQNKRKRKEPQKPWGKSERLLVLSVLLTTVLLSASLGLFARDFKLPGFPRLALPSFDFFEGETIIIEGNKQNEEKSKKIIEEFKTVSKNLSGVYGLYVIRLNGKGAYGIFEKEKFEAASLMKLPVFATLYREVEKGNIDLDTKYTLKNSDKLIGSGSLSSKAPGTVLTYRDLARLMGKQSDNTANGIIRRILGDAKINQTISELGMTNTTLTEYSTSPYDIGIFFEKLYKNQIVKEKYKNEILDYLTDTIYENWLVAGVSEEVRVAHKYGRELHVVNDAGVVFTKEPFVLVIMTKGVVEKEADSIFPELAKTIYEIETGNE